MLKTLTEAQKLNWKESLNKLMYPYNCTRCEVMAIHHSLFLFYLFIFIFNHYSHLLYGRSPRLPVDVLFGLYTESGFSDHCEYVDKWKKGMKEAHVIAYKNAEEGAARSKKYYDTKVRSSLLQPG